MSGDVPSDSENNVFKSFGQRDSEFSLLYYYFFGCTVIVREDIIY